MRADRQVPYGEMSLARKSAENPHYPHCIRTSIKEELPSAKETIQH